jgi:hypothetical protein
MIHGQYAIMPTHFIFFFWFRVFFGVSMVIVGCVTYLQLHLQPPFLGIAPKTTKENPTYIS